MRTRRTTKSKQEAGGSQDPPVFCCRVSGHGYTRSMNEDEDYNPADAYEWGDPKNPEYLEWLLDEADTATRPGA